MDQSKKALIAVALLVIAGGLFFWQFKPRKAAQAEITQDAVLNSAQLKALESIFRKVGSKKWSDPSLWSSAEAAKKYSGVAKEFFTESPSATSSSPNRSLPRKASETSRMSTFPDRRSSRADCAAARSSR